MKRKHQYSNYKNFEGKADGMEKEATIRIWNRSLQMNIRYSNFNGDGDSSAFNSIFALNNGQGPYTVPVVKEECVNHVSKRLGSRLRTRKNEVVVTKTKTGKTRKMSTFFWSKHVDEHCNRQPNKILWKGNQEEHE